MIHTSMMKLKTILVTVFLSILFILPSQVAAQSTPVKIMPLGDSITEIGSAYRYELYCKLKKNGFNVDFVGSNQWSWDSSTCYAEGTTMSNVPFDKNQEGHSGWTTGGLAGQIRGWMESYRPDIVLIHAGTNDVLGSPWSHIYDDQWGNKGAYTYLTNIIKDIRAVNPNATILLGTTIPVDPSVQNANATVRTSDLVTMIERVYREQNTSATSKLILVDHYRSGFDSSPQPNPRNPQDISCEFSKHTYDCIHPNTAGGIFMANTWYTSLAPVLRGQNPPQPTTPPNGPTATLTPRPTNTPVPSATKAPTPVPTTGSPSGSTSMKGLKVQGNKIVNDAGQAIRLIGVNRSGTEYACVGGNGMGGSPWGVFEDHGNLNDFIKGLKSWNINTIRVPLNETCWLGYEPDTRTNMSSNATEREAYLQQYRKFSGENYRKAIEDYVTALTNSGFAVILEIHWAAPGKFIARGQSPMLNKENSIPAWKDIANRFKGNSSVIFDLHNEPYHPWNNAQVNSAPESWKCWKEGSLASDPNNSQQCKNMGEWWDQNGNAFNNKQVYNYQVAGMQELVSTVRSTGASNIIMLGGLAYSNNLSRWYEYRPADTNIAASWHIYNFNADCVTEACWNSTIKDLQAKVPVVVGEVGMAKKSWDGSTLTQDFLQRFIPFLDTYGIHYLAWTWNFWGCDQFQLIQDFSGKVLSGCTNAEQIYAYMQNSLKTSVPISPGVSATPVQNTVTPVPTACLSTTRGDANCDGKVTLADFEQLRREMNGAGSKQADFDKNGKVDRADYQIWLNNY